MENENASGRACPTGFDPLWFPAEFSLIVTICSKKLLLDLKLGSWQAHQWRRRKKMEREKLRTRMQGGGRACPTGFDPLWFPAEFLSNSTSSYSISSYSISSYSTSSYSTSSSTFPISPLFNYCKVLLQVSKTANRQSLTWEREIKCAWIVTSSCFKLLPSF